jgi:magnesium-transporting ATPase (P-type)
MGVEESAENHFVTTLEISQEMKDLIAEVIAANSDVRFEVNEKSLTYEPKGQEIEVALIRFLIDNEIPAYDMLKVRNLYARKIHNFPYSTKEPIMVVVREVASSPDLVRVYVKGAPEIVLKHCERYYNNQFMPEDLNENEKSNILDNHIVDMAQRAQKVISYAYKEMSLSDLDQMIEDFQNNLEDPEFK